MLRPLKAAIVSSTKPLSFNVSVWIATAISSCSATERQQSIAAGVVPQSSCSLRPQAPDSTISTRAFGSDAFPLPKKPRLTGMPSAACRMRARCHGPGVQVVAAVPAAGPGTGAGPDADLGGGAALPRCRGARRNGQMDVAVAAGGGDHPAPAANPPAPRPKTDAAAGLNGGIPGLANRKSTRRTPSLLG